MIPLFKVLINEPKASENVKEVLNSGYLGDGEIVKEFETKFQKLLESKRKPIMLNSCTSALDLAFDLVGLEQGDWVISSPQSCFASVTQLPHRGVNICWSDINPYTGLIDVDSVKNRLDSGLKPKAIIAVDWAGHPCAFDELKSFGIPIIEDAAHGPLINYKGESTANTGGDYVAYSFQAIKVLTASDSGALIVPDEKYELAKLKKWYGLNRESSQDFRCEQDISKETVGYKYQSNNILGAIALANIELTQWAVNRQRENAAFYSYALEELSDILYVPQPSNDSSWWLYTIVLKQGDRDSLMKHLKSNGIECSLVHRNLDAHSVFDKYRRNDLAGLKYFNTNQCSIPNGWWLTPENREYIVDVIKGFLKK